MVTSLEIRKTHWKQRWGRMTKITGTSTNRCRRGCRTGLGNSWWEQILNHCWWHGKLIQPLCNSLWIILKYVKNKSTPCTILWHIPKGVTIIFHRFMLSNIIAAEFTLARWKPRCISPDEWIMRCVTWTLGNTIQLWRKVKIANFTCKYVELEMILS